MAQWVMESVKKTDDPSLPGTYMVERKNRFLIQAVLCPPYAHGINAPAPFQQPKVKKRETSALRPSLLTRMAHEAVF